MGRLVARHRDAAAGECRQAGEGVTDAAGKLQKLGVIRYRRGRITVLNRPQLERLCCECYGVVKTETERLLPHLAR